VAHCDPKGKNPPARGVGKNLTEKPAYVHKQEQWWPGGVEEHVTKPNGCYNSLSMKQKPKQC